ncbi:hypothetical protein [Roseimaritima multifibrata]|uniref:hypothetical protein n=1 Tax=Roseimaritima multifibrata TaxID=1930274 RepID=UPI0011A7574E|nr:hypothetical protein [Roseimaritima multifibrata]
MLSFHLKSVPLITDRQSNSNALLPEREREAMFLERWDFFSASRSILAEPRILLTRASGNRID